MASSIFELIFGEPDDSNLVRDPIERPKYAESEIGGQPSGFTDQQRQRLEDAYYQGNYGGEDTDMFGNPLSTDDFGNTRYQESVDARNQALNSSLGMDDLERPSAAKEELIGTEWWRRNAKRTKEMQDSMKAVGNFALDVGEQVADGLMSLFNQGNDLYDKYSKEKFPIDSAVTDLKNTDVMQGLMKFFEDDKRSLTERAADTEKNIVEPARQKIKEVGEGVADFGKDVGKVAGMIYDDLLPDADVVAKGILDFLIKPASGSEDTEKKRPRNVRNNNPGNIKINPRNKWNGRLQQNEDKTFEIFSTPQYGVRALNKVVDANIRATSNFEEFVNRYASEPKEKAYYKKNGKLLRKLQNYANSLASSQGIDDPKKPYPKNIDKLSLLKKLIQHEGGPESLSYYTDEVISQGLKIK